MCLSRTRADIALAPVMFMRNGATKNLAPPPEEVKLYALRASSDLHPWADTGDVCSIVDAKAQLPGMILNPSRLRRAVCDELAARQPEFEERYRRRRIQHQRALEQMVRERAAEKCKKRAVAKRASASAAAGNDSTSVAERRLQERNRAVASLEQLGSELRTLRARVRRTRRVVRDRSEDPDWRHGTTNNAPTKNIRAMSSSCDESRRGCGAGWTKSG